MLMAKQTSSNPSRTLVALLVIFFISGFTALLYQVVWQRMLGLFLGSDVRSVSVVVASYLLGLGVGSLIGGQWSDRLSRRQAVQIYGLCSLVIAIVASLSRVWFYDLLFRQWQSLASSLPLMSGIVFLSLLLPTALMGLSLPLLAKATSAEAEQAAARIGLLYGINTLGSGLGTLISGWYLVGTVGYEATLYLGASLSGLVGLVALASASQFDPSAPELKQEQGTKDVRPENVRLLLEWCLLVFCSGLVAIALEILWFRVLDIALQSIAYTYAHLLAFILVSNAVGSLIGARVVRTLRQPRRVFLVIQGLVVAYSALAIWLISLYWQSHPELREDIGYIDPHNITSAVVVKYFVFPLVMMVPPNLLLGFYVPLVQQAVQTDDRQIGWRVGLIQVVNILGNTTGSLLTGLVLLEYIGTAMSLRLLTLIGLGLVVMIRPNWMRARLIGGLALLLIAIGVLFPSNARLWAALHSIPPQQYFKVAEDSTGVAAVTEVDRKGTLLASGQAQAQFPYMQVHLLLGTVPALLHPHPTQVLIIGLGSGGTPHTIGVNPLTQHVRVVELLGSELTVLRQYAQTAIGESLKLLFQDPRYEFVVGDGRRELVTTERQFDIIEADAINPWRSRAGMLYSQEFFQEVRSRLAPGGFSVQWNVGTETEQTFRNVFPHVMRVDMMNYKLSFLIGCEQPIVFDRKQLVANLDSPDVVRFLTQIKADIPALRTEIQTATTQFFSHAKNGQPPPMNTDLFPRSEYYLNQPVAS
jgi:spermidine synthase